MAQIPDMLTNKFHEGLRNLLGFIGLIAGGFAWWHFAEDQNGVGIIASMICIGAFAVGAKIKVHYYLDHGKIVYK